MIQRVVVVGATGRIGRHVGGWIGTGRCWTPWIHIAYEAEIVIFALRDPVVQGPVNLTSPGPAR